MESPFADEPDEAAVEALMDQVAARLLAEMAEASARLRAQARQAQPWLSATDDRPGDSKGRPAPPET